MLAVEELLQPIDAAAAGGQNLRYDPVFDSIREARREEDSSLPMGSWTRVAKRADYPLAASLAEEALRKRSKDLWLAVWLGEASIQMRGYDALEPVFGMLTGLQRQFWSALYPEIEDGDITLRAAPLQWACDRYADLILNLPVTQSGSSYAEYKSVRASSRQPKSEESGEDALAEALDAALNETDRSFYAEAAGKLAQAQPVLEEFRSFCDEHYGEDGPSFAKLRDAWEELQGVINQQLRARQPSESAAIAPVHQVSATASAPAPEENHETPLSSSVPSQTFAKEVEAPEALLCAAAPQSWDDALQQIESCAGYLLEQEPGHPACYLLAMAVQFGRDQARDSASFPASEERMILKRAREDGDWEALLPQTLRAIMNGRSRWLDPQRYAWQAAGAGGKVQLQALVAAVTRTLLVQDPGLAQGLFDDDTPVANGETLRWLELELTPSPATGSVAEEELAGTPPLSAVEQSTVEIDTPVASAWRLMAEGEPRQAIRLLLEFADTARSGRETYLRRMEVCRMCLRAKETALAANMLRHMVAEAEDRCLEHWEDSALLGASLAMLLDATRGSEECAGERKEFYRRLCEVDPARALDIEIAE